MKFERLGENTPVTSCGRETHSSPLCLWSFLSGPFLCLSFVERKTGTGSSWMSKSAQSHPRGSQRSDDIMSRAAGASFSHLSCHQSPEAFSVITAHVTAVPPVFPTGIISDELCHPN